jgi:hypothetical protein
MTDEYLKKPSYERRWLVRPLMTAHEANYGQRTQFGFRAKPVYRSRPESSGLRFPALAIRQFRVSFVSRKNISPEAINCCAALFGCSSSHSPTR